MTTTDRDGGGLAWLSEFSEADFDADHAPPATPGIITVAEASERQETARLALLAAEAALRAARAEFRRACAVREQAVRAEQFDRDCPPLFSVSAVT